MSASPGGAVERPPGREEPGVRRLRRGYVDWLRGIAVLIMIEAHLLDSWTRFPDRQTQEFAWAMIAGGLGAPLFLFLAGVAVPLSAGSKFRRSGDVRSASLTVVRRGLEIFGLAFLFRIQAWVLGWSSPRALLKVDILNIMGPSIVAAAALWGAARTTRGRFVTFTAALLAFGLLTPLVRALPVLSVLPDPIEAYIRPTAGLSNFVLFPWVGFVFAGALVGLALDTVQTPAGERRANLAFALGGLAVAISAYAASFRPSWYPQSSFWTTSPSFFFLRVGIMTAAVAAAYLWESRPGGAERWSPMRQLGRTSLFIYWIHVEMVYGLISLPWHKHLSLGQACLALVGFGLFMLLCSILKDRVVEWWNRRPNGVTDLDAGTRTARIVQGSGRG
jgi:uncharacterized membrane protein